MKKNKYLFFIIQILLPLILGYIGSLFTRPNIQSWFQYLQKPFFSPPNWLFAPVWTLLYFLMGLAAFLVFTSNKRKYQEESKKYYYTQLVFNLFWSILFFGLRSPFLAFIEIVILWYSIYKTIFFFRKINIKAAYLLYPYLAWVSFATILNFSIYILN